MCDVTEDKFIISVGLWCINTFLCIQELSLSIWLSVSSSLHPHTHTLHTQQKQSSVIQPVQSNSSTDSLLYGVLAACVLQTLGIVGVCYKIIMIIIIIIQYNNNCGRSYIIGPPYFVSLLREVWSLSVFFYTNWFPVV